MSGRHGVPGRRLSTGTVPMKGADPPDAAMLGLVAGRPPDRPCLVDHTSVAGGRAPRQPWGRGSAMANVAGGGRER